MYDKQVGKKKMKKKGHLKINVGVDIKTKEILALEVTDKKVHDGKIMPKLIEHVLKRSNKNKKFRIKSVLADGAYDINKNFKYLEKKKIRPCIKVRKSSIIAHKNNRLRNTGVNSQIKDLFKWKKRRKYGKRWMAETVFSSTKRMFGEYVDATKFQTMIKEIVIKTSLYNLFSKPV
jgi:hypothetical protein